MDWISGWIAALTKPKETFATAKTEASVGEATKMFALVGIVMGLLVAVLLLAVAALLSPALRSMGVPPQIMGLGFVGIILIPILFAVAFVLTAYVSTWIFNFVCKLLGGQGAFEQMYFLMALVTIPITIVSMIAGIIPILGVLINLLLVIYAIYLTYLIVKEVHGFDVGKFIIAIIIDAVITLVLSFIVGFIFAMLFAGIFASLMPKPGFY